MPYAFVGRSWESKKYNSIDILDALGSSIRIDVIIIRLLELFLV